MLSNVKLYEDFEFSADNLTKGECGGYYTRIDTFELFCRRDKASTPEKHDYCEHVFVDCLEAQLPENTINGVAGSQNSITETQKETRIETIMIKYRTKIWYLRD